MRIFAYVDGLNLYYGALEHSSHRWLNLAAFLATVSPGDTVDHIHYCTAIVVDRDGDTGPRLRQQMYLRALRTLPNLTIHLGKFTVSPKLARLANPVPGGPQKVQIVKTEEKGTDVRLGSRMVADACHGRFDAALVVTNDTDLVPPIEIIRSEMKLPVWVLAPVLAPKRRVAGDLRRHATRVYEVRAGALAASQFPAAMSDANGHFTKPATW